MDPIDQFLEKVSQISSDYDNDDITYNQASVVMDEAIADLRQNYLGDVPDEVMEECFSAYAELQIHAFTLRDITEGEAGSLIEERASQDFGHSREPKEIGALWEPYIERIEKIARDEPGYEFLKKEEMNALTDLDNFNMN